MGNATQIIADQAIVLCERACFFQHYGCIIIVSTHIYSFSCRAGRRLFQFITPPEIIFPEIGASLVLCDCHFHFVQVAIVDELRIKSPFVYGVRPQGFGIEYFLRTHSGREVAFRGNACYGMRFSGHFVSVASYIRFLYDIPVGGIFQNGCSISCKTVHPVIVESFRLSRPLVGTCPKVLPGGVKRVCEILVSKLIGFSGSAQGITVRIVFIESCDVSRLYFGRHPQVVFTFRFEDGGAVIEPYFRQVPVLVHVNFSG